MKIEMRESGIVTDLTFFSRSEILIGNLESMRKIMEE